MKLPSGKCSSRSEWRCSAVVSLEKLRSGSRGNCVRAQRHCTSRRTAQKRAKCFQVFRCQSLCVERALKINSSQPRRATHGARFQWRGFAGESHFESSCRRLAPDLPLDRRATPLATLPCAACSPQSKWIISNNAWVPRITHITSSSLHLTISRARVRLRLFRGFEMCRALSER